MRESVRVCVRAVFSIQPSANVSFCLVSGSAKSFHSGASLIVSPSAHQYTHQYVMIFLMLVSWNMTCGSRGLMLCVLYEADFVSVCLRAARGKDPVSHRIHAECGAKKEAAGG